MTETADHLKLVEPAAEATDPLVGKVLDGRYAIERVLGEGGMGLVYRATHTTLNKPLAIKVLKADVSKDQEIVQRFRQEAQSATSIGNEHIIDISDFGVLDDGCTYFVMEFLDGIALTDAIQPGKPIESVRTYHIAKQLCRALGAAHSEGIVHRDLKPDNIYLIKRGGDPDFVKVLDFGIAKVGGGNSKLTQAGQVFGTPHYMSPEQCKGTAVDQRTDIYALGVIMYEMASSRVPFDADNLMGILTKHLYEEPIAPHELPPPTDVPPALEAIILKCLSKSREQRYQSMQEVYQDLEKASAGATPGAVMDRVSRASGGTGSAWGEQGGASGLTVDVGDLPGQRKGKAPLLLGLLALLLAGAAGAFLALSPGDDGRQAEAPAAAPVTPSKPEPEPEPEPAPEPEPVAKPEPPAPVKLVTVRTTPESVEVYRDGSLIGSTPYEVPRPVKGEPPFDIELRISGYVNQTVRISRFTQENLNVRMKKERKRRRSVSKPKPKLDRAKKEKPAPEKKEPMRRKGSSEVLDPWS